MEKGQGHEKDFLTVGSMGHASSIAMGIAMSKPSRQVNLHSSSGMTINDLEGGGNRESTFRRPFSARGKIWEALSSKNNSTDLGEEKTN